MRNQQDRSLVGAVILLACLFSVGPVAWAQDTEHPLEPPDTSSPRATLVTFNTIANQALDIMRSGEGRTYHNLAQRLALAKRLTACFDLNDIAPLERMMVARETAVYLTEIFSRVELPQLSEIPDAAAIAALPGGLPQWTIPHTEITLVRTKDGLHPGRYVFSSETDDRAREFFLRVRDLPYKPGATEGLYEMFSAEPGWMIPRTWIHALPSWSKQRYGDQALWQWFGMIVTLAVAGFMMVVIYRIGGRCSRHRAGLRYHLALSFPILAMLVPLLASVFLSQGVFLTGRVYVAIAFVLDLIALGALVVVILGFTNRLATAVGSMSWFQPRSVDAQLVQLVIRVCGVAGSVVAILEGGRYLGVPLTTLIAGASVSGLAVALAAQDGLKNLFGSLMIILDKPFEVGDLIKIKGYEGTVEVIGLRSTKLRLASGHLVTIANEEAARLDSENISRRAHLRRSEIIRLKADTPAMKVQRAVTIIRAALENHEGFDPEFPPSVNAGSFGADAVSITMTYWYHPADQAKFAAFNEKLNLRLIEKFEAEGIRLA